MTWWMILLIILAALWLIGQLRLGGMAHYGPDGMTVTVIAGPARIQVVPAKEEKKPKEKKKEKAPKEQLAEGKTPEEEKPGTLSRLMKLLPVVAEAAGTLLRKIRIDELYLSVVWGGQNDAAAAAIGYGRAHAAIGMIWPLLDHNFKVKKSSFHVDVDYAAEKPVVVADAALTMTLGQLLSFVIRYGLKALINWNRSGKPAKQ